MKKVAILYGGWSHESNLCGFHAISKVVEKLGYVYETFECDSKGFIRNLMAFQPDVAFLASHGTFHEDGKLQGLLEYLDIPYTGSGVTASAIGMNKLASKQVFQAAGLNVAPYEIIDIQDDNIPTYNILAKSFGDKFILKPLTGGASVGLELITNEQAFDSKIQTMLLEFKTLMAEKFLNDCREFTVGVHELFGKIETLPICEVVTYGKLCTFDMKNSNTAKFDKIIPADLTDELTSLINETTLKAFRAIGADTYSRVDIMISKDKVAYVLEINTLPGLLPDSVLPKEFSIIGTSYGKLVDLLINSAKLPKRHEPKKLYNNKPTLSQDIIDKMLNIDE